MIRAGLDAVHEAARCLQNPGAVLLVPTETVYGLLCRADDSAAVEKIYRMKHRDAAKRLGCFVAGLSDLKDLCPDRRVEAIAGKYCPGPLTIIARRKNGDTIGFRIPDHPFLQALLRETGMVLAQTSANRSGRPNVRTADEALAELAEEPDIVIDGGAIPEGAQASTVLDATGEELRIVRQGKLVIAEASGKTDSARNIG